MAEPEWKLDKSADAAGSYRFANTNPRMVFALALCVALATIICVYLAFTLISAGIEAGLIPEPLAVKGLVE
ncbi:hypothetical protein [Aurantiacibacter rhizosphaerae]|uniref:Uncharacterized protein n=1 Tax=Aurantiacibacter rhizosphaerae TaxID=2691582 RepID=A0A844XG54_9SPHN|nr:hypothetical protein [Aurantiacibacter rhizosphaerae]MWV28800.1 hypothetical protein [Aurantiacibacter rhizosphaerae]